MVFTIDRASGGYRAHLWSGKRLVWWTEVYVNKASARNAIRIAQASANAPTVDRAQRAA
jgi:uncharacterized protein YegP (UPF0339 family)